MGNRKTVAEQGDRSRLCWVCVTFICHCHSSVHGFGYLLCTKQETKHHIFKGAENNFKNLLMRKITGEVMVLDAERRKQLMPTYWPASSSCPGCPQSPSAPRAHLQSAASVTLQLHDRLSFLFPYVNITVERTVEHSVVRKWIRDRVEAS